MAKWASQTSLEGGTKSIDDLAGVSLEEWLISSYTAGDSYATVAAAKVAGVSLAAGDVTLSVVSNNSVMTVSAKSGVTATADSGATPDLHLALINTADSSVRFVTDETSDQVVSSGNTVNLPSWTWTVGQPT